ncbi:MAG: DUF805 domain-containing protein [Sphingomonadales bacterium]|nr:MAG: DUF805 domain-containing protein [Sphingomonadales bacterium]
MKALNIRYNRATYLTFLSIFVALIVVLANVMERPPGMGEVVLVLLGVPRLHDLGRSGWWMAAPIVAEIGLVTAMLARGSSLEDMQIGAGALTLAILVAMIVLGLIPGEDGPNRWGDPPPNGINWRNPRRL